MLQVCGQIKHVVVFVALHSCHHFTCCQLFPHIHSLQISVDSWKRQNLHTCIRKFGHVKLGRSSLVHRSKPGQFFHCDRGSLVVCGCALPQSVRETLLAAPVQTFPKKVALHQIRDELQDKKIRLSQSSSVPCTQGRQSDPASRLRCAIFPHFERPRTLLLWCAACLRSAK